jgi:hypothetical protein
VDVYDSLTGTHPNGNPLPFFGAMCPEQLLTLCIPRALRELQRTLTPMEVTAVTQLLQKVSTCSVQFQR